MSKQQYSKGQMTMALAAQLNDAGMDAENAMNAAMETMEAGYVPAKWRERLGNIIADAIDADIADPKTWRRA